MKYIYIEDNKAVEVLPEYAPEFPNIPITDRYPAEFLDSCVIVADDTVVEQNDDYVNGEFKKPISLVFDLSETMVTYTVNTEGLPMITADDTVVITSTETGIINFTAESYGNIHIKFIATDGRQADYSVYVGEAPIEPVPVEPTDPTLEERVTALEAEDDGHGQRIAALEAENEMISDVLDALLMGDIL